MEEAIPYCGNLHIDAATRKLILNLLGSIRTVVPVAPPPGPGTPVTDPDRNPDVRSQENIRDVLILARQHSEKLDGLFNPDELLRYSRYIYDYQDLMDHLVIILQEMKSCRDSAWIFASKMADMVEDHISMCAPVENHPEKSEQRESFSILYRNIKLKVV